MKTKKSFRNKFFRFGLMCCLLSYFTGNLFAQSVGINATGATPNAKALLDIDATGSSSKGGLLMPRLTTTERNAITTPIPMSLLIFNTTTECFEAWNQTTTTWVAFGCLSCQLPSAVTVSASPNTICVGSILTLTGGATNATAWQWTGPNGFTSTLQSPTIAAITTAGAGVYTLIASNACGAAVQVNTASVTVNAVPTTANAGTDITPACGTSTTTLAGNTPVNGTGTWSVISGTATITTPSSPTSGVTGLVVSGTATLRWTISNSPCTSSSDDVVITTSVCFTCGNSFTDSRDGKTYSTVLIGAQCWMKQNLNYGTYAAAASPQVSGTKFCYGNNTANCTTYGGLYEWSNIMNGSATCNGSGAPPNDKCPTNVQGLCPSGWHVPSHYEWTTLEKNIGSNPGAFPYDVTTGGSWAGTDEGGNLKQTGTTNWTAPNTGATNSSGFLALPGGYTLGGTSNAIGTDTYWWTSTDGGTAAWSRRLRNDLQWILRFNGYSKVYGMSVRCLKD